MEALEQKGFTVFPPPFISSFPAFLPLLFLLPKPCGGKLRS